MSDLVKSRQPGLPFPNVIKKPHPNKLMILAQSEFKPNAVDHVAQNKLETCSRLPTFIQTKANLIPNSGLKGTCSALESGLHIGKKRTKSLSTSPKIVTGMLEKASGIKSRRKTTGVINLKGHKILSPKTNLQSKDARPKLRLSAAADATFEMQKEPQRVVVDYVDNGAGSSQVREHLHVSENDHGDWEAHSYGQEEETISYTFLVTSSLVEQDADRLKSVDAVQNAVQNDPNKRYVDAGWSNATFQVESGLTELEGKPQAQLALGGVTYTTMTDDEKVELDVLPRSKIDYYKTCYDVSVPSAKASVTNLLNSGGNPAVKSFSDHQPLYNVSKQQKKTEGVLDCGGNTETDQLALELSNCHQKGEGNNHNMVCFENLMLSSGVIGSHSNIPSPNKDRSSPSTDSALQLNLTFLHTSTPKALAETVSWFPGSRLQAHKRSKVLMDLSTGIIGSLQSKPTKSNAAHDVWFSDALLDSNNCVKFNPSVSSAGKSRRDLKCGRKSATRNLKVLTCNEKQNKLVKNNIASDPNVLLSSPSCEQSGPEISTVEKVIPVHMPKELTSSEGYVLDEGVEGKLSSTEAFNELEFEVFENEDYRIKPDNSKLSSSYLKDFGNHRHHQSIVNFSQENVASFFLTDVVNLTHLCQMSYSVDSVNTSIQQQSKASPGGHLQKSFSSPDKFSDLSFAQLPVFGVELAPKADGNSNLNVAQRFKESHQTHAFVSRAASEMSEGRNDLVEDLKKFDVFGQNTGLCISNTCRKAGCGATEFEHPAKVNRSNNNDVNEDDGRQTVSSTHADDICLDSKRGYSDHLYFQDASSSSDDLRFVNSGQMNVVEHAVCAMTTAPPCSSVSLTPGVGSDAAATGRQVSSARRQLPVPQVVASGAATVLSSRISPPRSQLPVKVPEKTNSSLDNCVMVGVEMQKHVKVEMVKQVKVSCAVQEKCESRLTSASVLNKDDPKIASSARNSPRSPLESSRRQSNRTSKIGMPLLKASIVPSGRSSAAQPLFNQQKEKSESERSGAVSAPPVGIESTIRKGTPRQLPNTDHFKHPKQKESVEMKGAGPEPVRTDNAAQPQVRRLSVFRNIEKMSGNGKSKLGGGRPSNLATKPMLENSDKSSSKIGRVSIVNSSASSSASSSVPASQTAQKRSLRQIQVIATNSTQKNGREMQVDDLGSKKTNAELKSVKKEPKLGGQNESRAPETNSRSSLSDSRKPAGMFAVRKSLNLRSGLPAAKQILLSAVNKESASSRRASSSSVCSSIKSEVIGQNNVPVYNSQSPSEKKLKGIKSEDAVIVQYPHQPDVVSNSVLRELPIRKLHELEVQCKDLAKQVHSSGVQLRNRTTAFEAMITVVKYYVEQVASLSENISVLRSQLVSSNAKCDVLRQHRNAFISEIQGLKEDHEVEVNGMTVTHQMELHALQEKTKTVIKQVEEQHLKMAADLQQDTQRLIEVLKAEHKKEMEARGQIITDAETKHKQKLTDLQRSHDNRLKELKAQFETVKSALVEKMDHLNAECTELRLHNQNLPMDADPGASNNFGTTSEAEKQAENLKQEVESLKVVVELRNQENNKLRKRNVALEAQLGELAEAKQRIHQLEQKLENTEAIVHMKADYERELAEKHTTLLRRYSKESKVNKRLSMNNEELMWKLNQAAPVALSPASPKLVRRSHSGPPTKSAPGTPLVFRRSQPEMGSESFFSSNDSAQDLEDPNHLT